MSSTSDSNDVSSQRDETMTKLSKKYSTLILKSPVYDAKFYGMFALITAAIHEFDKQKHHLALKKQIEKEMATDNDPLFAQYLNEFDEYHYTAEFGGKYWNNADGRFHRSTRDADGKQLPACMHRDGSLSWCINGQRHRTDKDADGMTLPAYIDINGEKRWQINGEQKRDDRDEFGNTLPSLIETNGSKAWYQNDRLGRAELGKNPNDEDYNKALPAKILSGNRKIWQHNGKGYTQEELTAIIKKTQIFDSEFESIRKLFQYCQNRIDNFIGNMANNYRLMELLIRANSKNNICHRNLRTYIMEHNDEVFASYMEECEHLHYVVEGRKKVWYNNFGRTSRTTKDATGLTLPAIVYTDGRTEWWLNGNPHRTDVDADGRVLPAIVDGKEMVWYLNGEIHRTDKDANSLTLPAHIESDGTLHWKVTSKYARSDVDEFGHSLPSKIAADGTQMWRCGDILCRKELGKNPADVKNYGKALPAVWSKNGNHMWTDEKRYYKQDELTKLLKNNEEKMDCTNIKEMTIKLKNGITLHLSSIESVSVLQT